MPSASFLLLTLCLQQPLRPDPVDSVVADLRGFVPARMAEDRIPGVVVALVRAGRVAWVGGFGVANSITREPVVPETVFPAASLGKPVTAYAALRMVDRGLLELDAPLDRYLGTPWLPDSTARARITLRMVLTHTSGLSNFLGDRDRRPRFPPGERFDYSGVGFMYLQRVLEAVGRGSIDSVVAREMLTPLGAGRVWFGQGPGTRDPVAEGHIPLGRAAAPFGIVFVPSLLLGIGIAAGGSRLARGRWRPTRRATILAAGAAAAATTMFLVSKASNPAIVPFFVLVFAVLVAVAALPAWLLRRYRLAGAALVLALLFIAARRWPVPVPAVPGAGNAASSLQATAGDLARILIAMAAPEAGLQDAAVPVSDHIVWGLGIGIQRSPEGDALFHWGRNPAARAAMVIYPETGTGVVVLANGGTAGDAVAAIALRAVGGPSYWADE